MVGTHSYPSLPCVVVCRAVSQLSARSESHVRPQDPSSAAAEVKLTDLVCPLYTLRWAAMQNVLSDLVGVRSCNILCVSCPPTAAGLVCSQHAKAQLP
jgi:hypothetical protein